MRFFKADVRSAVDGRPAASSHLANCKRLSPTRAAASARPPWSRPHRTSPLAPPPRPRGQAPSPLAGAAVNQPRSAGCEKPRIFLTFLLLSPHSLSQPAVAALKGQCPVGAGLELCLAECKMQNAKKGDPIYDAFNLLKSEFQCNA